MSTENKPERWVGTTTIISLGVDGEKYRQLEQRLAAAQEDSKRLDWLESVASDFASASDHRGLTIGRMSNFQNFATNQPNLRAAIDAARKESAK